LLAKVRSIAEAEGIDPDIAVRVWASEGPGSTMHYNQPGDHGTSGGAFQLHLGGPGSVGTEYERATGHSVFDPRYTDDYLRFTYRWVHQHGWGAWQGAAKQGIFGFTGVRGYGDPRPHDVPNRFHPQLPVGAGPAAHGAQSSMIIHKNLNVASINVTTSHADPHAIAHDVRRAIERELHAVG
jgi:hypothetical protein